MNTFTTHAELFDLSGKRALVSTFGEVRAIPADLSRHDECRRLSGLLTAGAYLTGAVIPVDGGIATTA